MNCNCKACQAAREMLAEHQKLREEAAKPALDALWVQLRKPVANDSREQRR